MLNREAAFSSVDRHIERCRDEGGVLAVLLLRIRRFRHFNIHFGFANGGRLVETVREMVSNTLRPADQIIQIGACDFAILLPGLNNPDHATLAASRMVRRFQEPVAIGGERSVLVDVAVGVALCPEHGTDANRLFGCAERAYSVAMQSIDRYAVFTQAGGDAEFSHEDLHDAIANNRLELHLQPLWDLRRDRLGGVEALARWGAVDPSAFVALAEQTGLIMPLTRWCLNNSLRYCAEARRLGLELPFSINLSPRVFAERGLVEQILSAMRIWDIAPETITLEVTETAVMDDPVLSARILQHLRNEGLRISIDDFGTGHSTFAYLQHMPATELKIDKSFVSAMRQEPRSRQLVRSMIELGGNLGLAVVAEGVEDAATLADLIELDCDYAQGYHIGRPQIAAAFITAQAAALSSAGIARLPG